MPIKKMSLPIIAGVLLPCLSFYPAQAQDTDIEAQEPASGPTSDSAMWSEEEFDRQIARIKDEKTRSAISLLGSTYFIMASIEKSNNLPVAEIKYIDDPYILQKEYQDSRAAIDAYLNSLEARYHRPSNSTYIKVSSSIELPFAYSLDWKKLDLANGQILEIYPEDPEIKKPGQLFAYEYVNGVNLWKWGNDADDPWGKRAADEEPLRLSGQLTATMAKDWTLNEFTADDIGQSRKIGDYVVTLKEIKANAGIFTIDAEIKAKLKALETEDFRIEARDKTGKYLNRSGSGSGHPLFMEAYGATIINLVALAQKEKLDEAELEKAGETKMMSFGLTKEDPLYFTYYFDGPVDKLSTVILSPENRIEITREIKLPIQYKEYD